MAGDYRLAPYALSRALRHGSSIERLRSELDGRTGEFGENHSYASALAFDAADFVWAALMDRAPASQESREVRNRVAEAILTVLKDWSGTDDGNLFVEPEPH